MPLLVLKIQWQAGDRKANQMGLEMYGHHTYVDVKAIELNKRILIEWDGPENPSAVEWTFEDKGDDRTLVVVKNWGFNGAADKVVAEAIDSTGGFTFCSQV